MRGLQCGTKLAFYGIAVEADAANEKGDLPLRIGYDGCLTFTSSISS